MQRYETDEMIYALATAYYPSALAIVRLSGDGVIKTLANVFSNKEKLLNAKTNTLLHGHLIDKDGKLIDEVVLSVYRKGHGYTSEEAIEINMHGSLALINKLFITLEELGIRKALPGEFTYRAFMHKRLDLSQAEAVEEIISAKSLKGAEDALSRLSGGLSKIVKEIKDELIDIISSLEVQLDYAEDEIIEDWVYPEDEVDSIIRRLDDLIGTYDSSRLYSQGAKIVLAGKTNAGKSSFFNALLKENRAIVSEIEGTTRDYIEAECVIRSIPCRLFDTAGLRSTNEEIEKEGIVRSKKLIEDADLVLYITDGSDDVLPPEDERTIIIYSKLDKKRKGKALEFSSLTGEGIKEVLDEVEKRLTKKSGGSDGPITIESEREKNDLAECRENLMLTKKNKELSVDLMSLLFQSALKSLDSLIGEVSSDEILDRLFSKFCLGK